MFYDKKLSLLNEDLLEIKTIVGDIQPYSKIFKFEDDIELEVRDRVFCDIEPLITRTSYFLVEGVKYKVMDIKRWSDYLEILIYECTE